MGRRWPDSNRDSVLTEIPVVVDNWANVTARCWRKARSRGPTLCKTPSKAGSSSSMPLFATLATMFVKSAGSDA
ncbi:hypothetical protein GCM10009765_29590 [Fodinicola feengrottensis]|uniref:Uncharacterized protein n=1 Tax=Fodinicola feengrottensis TaxID=435914 RepID=A0ABN2GYN5_9ACTN